MLGTVGSIPVLVASVSSQVSVGELILTAIGLLIAVPTAVLAVNSYRENRRRQDEDHIAGVVKQFLVGDSATLPTDRDNPNLRDLLIEIRDNTSELSIVSLILAYHLADQHGPDIPQDIAARAAHNHGWNPR